MTEKWLAPTPFVKLLWFIVICVSYGSNELTWLHGTSYKVYCQGQAGRKYITDLV